MAGVARAVPGYLGSALARDALSQFAEEGDGRLAAGNQGSLLFCIQVQAICK